MARTCRHPKSYWILENFLEVKDLFWRFWFYLNFSVSNFSRPKKTHKMEADDTKEEEGEGGHAEEVDLGLVERLLRESLPYGHRVVNAYLIGSRAIGLAAPDSDFDVVAVVESAEDLHLVGLGFLEFPEWNLNINVFQLPFFRNLLLQNVVWLLLVRSLCRIHFLI